MAAWFSANRKNVYKTGAVLAGWVLGTVVPNTVATSWFDSVAKQLMMYYKDAKKDTVSQELIDEVFRDISACRGYPVKTENVHFRHTTELSPSYLVHKGCSRLGDAFVVLPLGMRSDARDVYYLYCQYEQRENLENICLLNRDEQKFLYALMTVYSEDNYPLYCTALGSAILLTMALPYYSFKNYIVQYEQKIIQKELAKYNKPPEEMVRQILNQKSKFARTMVPVAFFVIGANLYWFLRGFLSKHLEKKAHNAVADLGPNYVKSGSDFYLKAIYYNLFLKDLGLDVFTPQGDEVIKVLMTYPAQLTFNEKRQIYLDREGKLENQTS